MIIIILAYLSAWNHNIKFRRTSLYNKKRDIRLNVFTAISSTSKVFTMDYSYLNQSGFEMANCSLPGMETALGTGSCNLTGPAYGQLGGCAQVGIL